MRKIILTLLILCVWISVASGGMLIRQVSEATACNATAWTSSTIQTTGSKLMYDTDEYYNGQSYLNPGADRSLCKATFYARLVYGDLNAFTYYCAVYTIDTAGTDSLDVLQGTSDGLAGSGISADSTMVFNFSTSVSLTNGTDYAFVLYHDGSNSTTNYIKIGIDTSDHGVDGGYRTWKQDKTTGAGSDTGDAYCLFYALE